MCEHEIQTSYEYIRFEKKPTPMTRKTAIWGCFSVRSGDELGQVKWYGAWRQFCFFPAPGTVFNVGCMNDVCHFIEQLMKNSRAKKKRASVTCILGREGNVAMDLRKVERWVGGRWEVVKMKDIREGDRFRMFESDGASVLDDDGCSEFVATSSPYEKDGVWGVDAEAMGG